MSGIGRAVLILGVILVIAGGVIMLLGRAGVPIGRLPGDITYRGKNTTVYFPIVTCIVVSVVLTVISWVIQHFRR